MAVQQSGAVYWMYEDPITKSKRVCDVNGNTVSGIETDPYGADTSRSFSQAFQPKKFTSYDRDANGSDEAMFRRYNRWHARFDQPDPLDGSYDVTSPQSFNRYAYTQGDPTNLIDPSGLFALTPRPSIGTFTVTVSGSWDDMTGYLPDWTSGALTRILFLHPLLAQNPLRPPKVPERIIERPKSPEAIYKACVAHEWEVFNQKVENIKTTAEEHSGWKSFWVSIFNHPAFDPPLIGPTEPGEPAPPKPPDIDPPDSGDILFGLERRKEIEEGTKRAAEDREKAIQNNCKKP